MIGWLRSCCRRQNLPSKRLWTDNGWSNRLPTNPRTRFYDEPIYDGDNRTALITSFQTIDCDNDKPILLPPIWSIVADYAADAAFLRYRRYDDVCGMAAFAWSTPHTDGAIYLPIDGSSYTSTFTKLMDIDPTDRPVRHRIPNMLPAAASATDLLRRHRIDDERLLTFMRTECAVVDRFCNGLQIESA